MAKPESQFSRGDWGRGIDGDEQSVYANGLLVATVHGPLDMPCYDPETEEQVERDIQETEANADLIAAAPELYAVVEKWVELWSRYKLSRSPYEPFVSEENAFIMELARDALVKAKGDVINGNG